MVGIIVHDMESVDISFVLESAVCALKGKQPLLDLFHRDVQKRCGSNGSQRIGHIVKPIDREPDVPCLAAFHQKFERNVALVIVPDIGCAEISVCIVEVIDEHVAVKICQNLIEMADLSIDNQSTVPRQKFGKGVERFPNVVNVFKKVHVIFLDVQNQADLREKMVIAVCVLARFGNKNLGAANPDITVDSL